MPSNVLRFADALFAEEDYRRAAVEYDRYLSSTALAESDAAAIQLKIGVCYQLAADVEKALRMFTRTIEGFPATAAALDARVQRARVLLLAGRYADMRAAVTEAIPVLRTPERQSSLAELHGASLLFEKRWADAQKYFEAVSERDRSGPGVTMLRKIAAEGMVLPRKSAALAGVMSTVVPGSGRFYAGGKADGITSFLSIATTGWLAQRGFRRDGTASVKGWIYGSLAAFLYVGNIYGSAVAVQIRNEQSEAGLLKRASVLINVDVR